MLGKVDDQLTRLNLNSRNVSVDEVSVVNRRCGVQTLPNRPDHQRFDAGAGTRRTDPARSAAPLSKAEDR